MELVTGSRAISCSTRAYTDDMSEVETPVRGDHRRMGLDESNLIIATDIFGGSVNNEFMKYLSQKNIHRSQQLIFRCSLKLVSCLNAPDTKKVLEKPVDISGSRFATAICS